MRASVLFSVLLLSLAACGGSGSRAPVQTSPATPTADGSWTAAAVNTQGQTEMGFTFQMRMGGGMGGGGMMGGGAMLGTSNLHWNVASGCFGPNAVMEGQMSGTGGPGGTRSMTMDLWSNPDKTGNHLHMVMTMNAGMDGATGTYTLTGVTPGCVSSSGTIEMHRR